MNINNYLNSKLVLGTASFTKNYSLFKKKIPNGEIIKIFNEMIKNKIFMIDTATRYFDISKILKKKKFKKINIIIKISDFDDLQAIINQEKKFKYINDKKFIYALLFHNLQDLKKNKFKEAFFKLKKNKRKFRISKVGFSVNDFKSIDKFLIELKPDIIQVPFSILDRRILNKKYQNLIKKYNIEVHIRSIFLRGLLTKEKFGKINLSQKNIKLLKKIHNVYRVRKLKPIMTCLQFVLNYKFYSKIIIGIDSLKHFKEILSFKQFALNNKIFDYTNNRSLIMPSRWKKNAQD